MYVAMKQIYALTILGSVLYFLANIVITGLPATALSIAVGRFVIRDINLEEFVGDDNSDQKNENNSFNFPYEISINKDFEQNSFINVYKNWSINAME